MAGETASVVPFPDKGAGAPFVPTTLARHMCSKLEAIHDQQRIGVFSGPWGIGKTSAINAFAQNHIGGVMVVNVVHSGEKGRTITAVLQAISQAFVRLEGYRDLTSIPSSSQQVLRAQIYNHALRHSEGKRLTIVFDEAQNLSRSAIESLRSWNDDGQIQMPCQVGLAFVGNAEFALEEDASGHSVLSGAVRSRAFGFITSYTYDDLCRDDIRQIVASRGTIDSEAVELIADYFCRPRIRRDLRVLVRVLDACRLHAEGGAITAQVARKVLTAS